MKPSVLARVFAVGLLAVAEPQVVTAQELSCRADETFRACSTRLAGETPAIEAATTAAIDEKRDKVAELASNFSSLLAGMNTGDSSTPTISDFLPLLRLLLDTGGSTADIPDKIGIECENCCRPVTGGIRVSNAPTNCAFVSHLDVANALCAFRQERTNLFQQIRRFQLIMSGRCTDQNLIAFFTDVCE